MGGRERETERGVFRGPALASWHLTICQNSPRSPFIARRSGGSLNLCASADDGRVPHPLLPRPHFPQRHHQRPPPPKDPTADDRSSSETAESRADRITSARRALSDLDSCDAFALLARLVKVTGVLPKCTRVSCFLHRKHGPRDFRISRRGKKSRSASSEAEARNLLTRVREGEREGGKWGIVYSF